MDLQTYLTAFPDARFEVSNIIVEGDSAGWRSRMSGTNTGSLMGMPPTGKYVDVSAVHMGRPSRLRNPNRAHVGVKRRHSRRFTPRSSRRD